MKLNGTSGIIVVIITLIIAMVGFSIKVGGKKVQIDRNTSDIVEIKNEQKDFRKEINTKFELVVGDLGLIKGSLGIKKKCPSLGR